MNFNKNQMEYKPVTEKIPGILDSLENQLLLARKLETVYTHRPDMDSFVGMGVGTKFEQEYTQEKIQSDKEYVKDTRSKIDEKNSAFGRVALDNKEGGFQLSEIMQAMIVDRLNNNWFKSLKSTMTSDYDDLKVGIDAVMKHKEGGVLGASLDFTVTNQDKIIYAKLQREWDNIKQGKVTTIKYFQDPDTGEKGKLLVPKFIIGASKKDVESLAKAYIENDEHILNNHPFKYVMLSQIEKQLQTIFDYYEINKDDPKLQFAQRQYRAIESLLRVLKQEIHMDEEIKNVDLYEYSKQSVSLDMMERFRIMKDHS